MTHTPGPWKLLRSVDGFAGATGDKDIGITAGGIIAEAFYRIDDYEYADVEANARLIAAAPELLEACLFVLDELEHLTTDDFSKGGDKPARDRLVEVIAKAGE